MTAKLQDRHTALRRKRPANIQDLARLVGVSNVTVSRAFSGSAPVAQQTRDRIMAAAAELNYRPSYLARGLCGGRTQATGVLASLNALTAGDVRNIIALMHDDGYVSHVVDHRSELALIEEALEEMAMRRVDAVILFLPGEVITDAKALCSLLEPFVSVVIVSAGLGIAEFAAFDHVCMTTDIAVREVVEHLKRCGRKRVAMFHPENLHRNQCKRYNLYHRYCQEFEVTLQAVSFPVPEEDSTASYGYDRNYGLVFKEYLKQEFPDGKFPYDAVICNNDDMGVAMIQWANDHGIRVGTDLAVVGCDDIHAAQLMSPPLATMRYDARILAQRIRDCTVQRLKDPDCDPQTCYVPYQFIRRESAGSPVSADQ